ncbi:MAG: Gfo/Idh/MocA family oxidoreductase [Arachnia sp.]
MGEPLRVGVVGCGTISGQYFDLAAATDAIDIVAVADVDPGRARAAAERTGARAVALDDVYGRADVEWILDLTTPAHHETVALAAIAGGASVYNEKPFCATVEAARRVRDAASAAGVGLGSAPDTVLGTGIQTSRAVVDSGGIGRPVFATATMVGPGHELWHPDPAFYYAPGGGPLLDMGPYYLTSLVTLLGPIASVYGAGRRTRLERVVATGPKAGERFPVQVDSHVTAICEHASGALSTLIMTFDGAASRAAHIEVHGEEGTLLVPDPNCFDGDVQVHAVGGEWRPVPPSAGYVGAGRGIGLVDVARGPDRLSGRANADVGFHVLDVMESILRSAETGRREPVSSTCVVPPPVPLTDDWRSVSAD